MNTRTSYRDTDAVLRGLEAWSSAPKVPTPLRIVVGGLAIVRGAVDDGLDRIAIGTDGLNERIVIADALAEQQRAERLVQAFVAFRETEQN